jgi:hypothetical protein
MQKGDVIYRQVAIDALWGEREKLDSYMDECLKNGLFALRSGTKAERNRIEEDIEIITRLPSAQAEPTRTFVELVVEYPNPELCTYKEYRGKPYYSIKYIENGETYIGYGTYKPEILSQYLKEYFILSAQLKLSCDGCKHLGMFENEIEYGCSCPCLWCIRRVDDNYEQ